jgi:signal transduction histidine kinase
MADSAARSADHLSTSHWRRRVLPLRSVPWAVLAGALLFTIVTSSYVRLAGEQRDLARFENAVVRTQDLIDRRVDLYLVSLRGAAALFSAMDTVTMDDFREYVDRLGVQRYFPGIQGMGWTERLSAGPDGQGGLEEVHAIRYLEPLDERNRAALGYDMYSEATRRAAMARARDEGVPALSGRVRLVQEIYGPEQAGFLLYHPVYAGGSVPTGRDDRRATLKGFVYSPFRADDLFRGIFGADAQPGVSFQIYSGTEVDEDHLLHASGYPQHRPAFQATRVVEQAGMPWTVTYQSTSAFERTFNGRAPLIVLLVGLATSAWLFSLARGQAEAREKAEAANRAKAAFLATMSHELRTPLNAIAGYVDLMDVEVAGKLTARQRDYLERIKNAQSHLLGLIDNILNFAKLEAGRIHLRMEPVPIATAVAEAESIMGPDFAARRLEYTRLGGDGAVARADPDKLRQILLNLLGNAIKFTDPGGRVTVRWEAEPSLVRVYVSDTGVGVPIEQLESIFHPFVQGDAELTRTSHGAGLGLAISRQLARAMGGDVTAWSEAGQGSTFTLSLPRVQRQVG